MHVLSVNIGLPRDMADRRGKVRRTGIVKTPAEGPVRITASGLDGDGQADLAVHGGADRAIYVYPAAHYRAWAEEKGRGEFEFGMFGENLTVEGVDERSVHIGDRFRLGGARLEVSLPRVPCVKLGIRFGDPTFPKRFLASRRTGFFFRVLEEGVAVAGDAFEFDSHGPGEFTVREILELFYGPRPERSRLAEAAHLEALPRAWREDAMRRRARSVAG